MFRRFLVPVSLLMAVALASAAHAQQTRVARLSSGSVVVVFPDRTRVVLDESTVRAFTDSLRTSLVAGVAGAARGTDGGSGSGDDGSTANEAAATGTGSGGEDGGSASTGGGSDDGGAAAPRTLVETADPASSGLESDSSQYGIEEALNLESQVNQIIADETGGDTGAGSAGGDGGTADSGALVTASSNQGGDEGSQDGDDGTFNPVADLTDPEATGDQDIPASGAQ